MAKANLTKVANIDATVRELDFATRFEQTWAALREILGIMRPIRKTPGTKLAAYLASCTLQDGEVGEGEEVPYSLTSVEPVAFKDLKIRKYAKAVSIEAVDKYGAAIAVQKTDDAFMNELTGMVMDEFYDFLQTGTLTDSFSDWQMAVSMAIGMVNDKFKKMRKTVTNIVVFVNTLDAYKYLGATTAGLATQYGITYIKNFLGAQTVILSSEIPENTVIAVPVDNIDLYYVDPADSDYARLGLDYTVAGETNLIGVHAQGNYNTVVGELFAILGMTLWAEYLDGIAVVTVDANP